MARRRRRRKRRKKKHRLRREPIARRETDDISEAPCDAAARHTACEGEQIVDDDVLYKEAMERYPLAVARECGGTCGRRDDGVRKWCAVM